jgi:hypothetical protein
MKTNNAFTLRLIGILLVYSILSIQGLKSQDVGPQNASPSLSGSRSKLEDVITKADDIFVGKMLQTGPITVTAPGQIGCSGNKIEVLQTLRGSVNSQITVSFNVHYDSHEQLPKVGNTYIFFVKKVIHPDPDPYRAIKLLPSTDDNIAKVKALIAATPTGK